MIVLSPMPAIRPSFSAWIIAPSWSSNFWSGTETVHQPEVDRRELVGLQAAEVVLDALPQLVGRVPRDPAALLIAARTHLGHQRQVVGVRVQGLVDELVGHVRAVVLRGVDVVDPGLDRPPQHRERLLAITGRSLHPGTGQLHRTEPDAGDLVRSQRKAFHGRDPRARLPIDGPGALSGTSAAGTR